MATGAVMNSFLPDDVRSARSTLRASIKDAFPYAGAWVRYVFFYLSLFAFGCLLFLGMNSVGVIDVQSSDLWKTAVGGLAVLSGFMITTMLFTGKVESAKDLSLEELRQFTEKSNHLLISQYCTLATHIAGIALMLVMQTSIQAMTWSASLVPLAGGFLVTSLFRSLLVPAQVIELHRFAHACLLRAKAKEVEAASKTI